MATRVMASQLVVFSLGSEEYGLPITQVQEIIRYVEPRSVACEMSWVRGVISLRGRIVPVCDLAARLGSSHDSGDQGKIVIVETENGPAGLMVDDVEEVLTLDESQLDSVPTATDDSVEAIAKVGDRLIVVLDPGGLFADVEFAAD